MNKDEEINNLIIETIESNCDINIISKLVYLYFKENDIINDNYSKIRIAISECIFDLFKDKSTEYLEKKNKYEENTKEWIENNEKYLKIYNIALKLKDAKFKDNIMKLYKKWRSN